MSTILPDLFWEPTQQHQPGAVYYERSPSFSSYGATSQQLVDTSLYVPAGVHARASGTPAVKSEDPATDDLHGVPLFQGSAFTEPSDLDKVSLDSSDHNTTRTTPSSRCSPEDSDYDDKKPVLGRQRPDNRRTFSAEDVQLEETDERRKRAYTKPESANCHCKQCGKLFQRNYNLKAHLETHDSNHTLKMAAQSGRK
ncbi:hypothetical protein B0A50_00602 [Salinomyces thailandicus]|uniref:C2H2-type domain-containing protein n=1 Tax=Salinomyces thailandicus TaxID=706561 RepID=A0A4U0UGH5_9PEZI|nr:hypothetical protein B0A50_00602 [Salinomyces thailandica]